MGPGDVVDLDGQCRTAGVDSLDAGPPTGHGHALEGQDLGLQPRDGGFCLGDDRAGHRNLGLDGRLRADQLVPGLPGTVLAVCGLGDQGTESDYLPGRQPHSGINEVNASLGLADHRVVEHPVADTLQRSGRELGRLGEDVIHPLVVNDVGVHGHGSVQRGRSLSGGQDLHEPIGGQLDANGEQAEFTVVVADESVGIGHLFVEGGQAAFQFGDVASTTGNGGLLIIDAVAERGDLGVVGTGHSHQSARSPEHHDGADQDRRESGPATTNSGHGADRRARCRLGRGTPGGSVCP